MNILEHVLANSPFRPQDNDTPNETLDGNLILIPEWGSNPSGFAVIATCDGEMKFIGHVVRMPAVGECEEGWHAIQHRMLHCGVYQNSEQAANAVKVGYFG